MPKILCALSVNSIKVLIMGKLQRAQTTLSGLFALANLGRSKKLNAYFSFPEKIHHFNIFNDMEKKEESNNY